MIFSCLRKNFAAKVSILFFPSPIRNKILCSVLNYYRHSIGGPFWGRSAEHLVVAKRIRDYFYIRILRSLVTEPKVTLWNADIIPKFVARLRTIRRYARILGTNVATLDYLNSQNLISII